MFTLFQIEQRIRENYREVHKCRMFGKFSRFCTLLGVNFCLGSFNRRILIVGYLVIPLCDPNLKEIQGKLFTY